MQDGIDPDFDPFLKMLGHWGHHEAPVQDWSRRFL